MAQVPDWTAVGERTPQPSYRRVFPDESGRIVGQGIGDLAAGLDKAADEDYQQTQRAAMSKANDALLDHQVSIADTTENIRQQVSSGQLPWDQVEKTYQDATSKLQLPDLPQLSDVALDGLKRQAQRQINTGLIQVQGIARAGRKQSFADDFQAAQDKLGKLAGMPDADVESINNQIDFYRQQGIEAGMPPALVDKSIQTFKDNNWYNQATQKSLEASQSIPDLKQLQHDLTAPDGFYIDKLDPARRDALTRSVQNGIITLENRQEHEQDKREARALQTMGKVDEQIASGIPATPAMWNQWETLTKGTSQEEELKDRIQAEAKVQDLLRQPIDQQIKYVQDQTQKLETEGGSLKDRANLLRLQQAVQQNARLMQTAPLLFSQERTGQNVEPLDFTALNTDQGKQAFQAQIADRMATLAASRKQYGPVITDTPLLPQEASILATQLDQATPQEKAATLISLRGAMNNDTAFRAAMRQVAPHSPVTAIAGLMVGSSSPASTPAWFDRAYAPTPQDVERVLHGEALLNPSKAQQAVEDTGKGVLKGGMPMPPDLDPNGSKGGGLRMEFQYRAGDLFRGREQIADHYYQVYRDAYAAIAAEQGRFDGMVHQDIQQQALNIALGNTTQFQGHTLRVPAGMDPNRFNGLLDNVVQATVKGAKFSPEWQKSILSGYGIQERDGLGSGRYYLTSGNQLIQRPDGKGPLWVDMRYQFLPHGGQPQ